MTLELRRLDGNIELREDGESLKIEGLGSVFFDPNDPGTEFELWPGTFERVMPGSFARVISEGDTRGLFNHDPNLILGRTSAGTMRIWENDKGMRYSIDPPKTSTGNDMVESLRRGDVSGSSIGFAVTKAGQKWKTEGDKEIREIHEFDVLWDAGPVTFAAFESTSSGVRALREARSIESKLGSDAVKDARRKAQFGHRRRIADMASLGIDLAGQVVDDPTKNFRWYAWDLPEARQWLKDEGFQSDKLDEDDNFFRFRQKDPGQFDSFRNIWNGSRTKPADFDPDVPVSRPVMFVRGKKNDKFETQSVVFYHGKTDQAEQ